MSRWFRFYEDAVNDPEVQALPAGQFKVWVNLLCLTSKNNGALFSSIDDIAFYIRETPEATKQAVDALIAAGLLEHNGSGVLVPSNWEQHKTNRRPDAAEWRIIRERIFLRDDYTCTYCGDRGVSLHCDHVFPVSAGGGHDDENLVTSCEPCNRAKRSKIVSVDEWRAIRSRTK